jgi:phospholipid/cholesterol/gamma-HCH transport system substrate-binding protein
VIEVTRVTIWVVGLAVVGTVLTGFLIAIFSGGQPHGDRYTALFVDASDIKAGSDVRVAGVTVGRVNRVEVLRNNTVSVQFELEHGRQILSSTQAAIKYKNLLGDRYMALTSGSGFDRLPVDGVIPTSQTRPALSLNELFDGFAPLFQGLQPQAINQLSTSIVSIFQGEGGSINSLLDEIGTFTGKLADRDKVIGDLLTNMNGVLATVDDNSSELDQTVSQLSELVSGLSRDRERIGHSITGINEMSASMAGLLREARPDIKSTVHDVGRLASVLEQDMPAIDDHLQRLPGYLQSVGRKGGYASAVQFYLCGVQLRFSVAGQAVLSPMIQNEVSRCRF